MTTKHNDTTRSHPLTVWLLVLCLWGCDRAADEPLSGKPPPAASENPLRWTAPPTWNVERTAQSGLYRAKYTTPAAGNASQGAELLISSLGRGKDADIDKKLEEFLGEFEGPGTASVERKSFKVHEMDVRTVELAATYRFPMGPPGPNKKPPAHVIKDGWRGIAAGVITHDRGNWFFRMVGPDDSVAAARSAFVSLLEGLE